jgi:FdhD protein
VPLPLPLPLPLPTLTQARVPLTRATRVVDGDGQPRDIELPDERALTLFVDRQELVTLMTLGQEPELLALGYLLNQGLVASAAEIESVTVDWSVSAAAVRTRGGIADWAERTARRTVTSGCGQGTAFGALWDELQPLPPGGVLQRSQLVALSARMRELPSVYARAGSVHGSALWRGDQLLAHVEDVGRHNAIDTLAGWMALQGVDGAGLLLYTTGRLTSEMVLKAARLRVPLLVSRNGSSASGQALAERLRLTLIGRASGRRFLCYAGAERIGFDDVPQPAAAAQALPAA